MPNITQTLHCNTWVMSKITRDHSRANKPSNYIRAIYNQTLHLLKCHLKLKYIKQTNLFAMARYIHEVQFCKY